MVNALVSQWLTKSASTHWTLSPLVMGLKPDPLSMSDALSGPALMLAPGKGDLILTAQVHYH